MKKTQEIKGILFRHRLSIICAVVFAVFISIYFNKAEAVLPTQTQADFAAGLNDVVFSGTFALSENATFTVMIDGINVSLPGSGCVSVSNYGGTFSDGDVISGGNSGTTAIVSTSIRCRNLFGETTGVYLTEVVGNFEIGEAVASSSGGFGNIYSTEVAYLEGGSDTISWTEVGGSGGSGSGVSIGDLSVTLEDGISVTLGAATGHMLGDYWTYSIAAGQTQAQTSNVSGLDDGVFSGVYDGEGDAVFTVTIDGVDTPSSDPASGCLYLNDVVGDFLNGDTVIGATSTATGGIPFFSNLACPMIMQPYAIAVGLENIYGTFQSGETITGSSGGSATIVSDNISYSPPFDTLSWTEVGGSGGSGSRVPLEVAVEDNNIRLNVAFINKAFAEEENFLAQRIAEPRDIRQEPIRVSSENLADGISIYFSSTTGHTLGDSWTYTIAANQAPLPPSIPVIRQRISSGGTIGSARTAAVASRTRGTEEIQRSETSVVSLTRENVKGDSTLKLSTENDSINKVSNNSNNTQTKIRNSEKLVFTKNIRSKIADSSVKIIQETLNDLGYTVAQVGPGSFGHETDYFGELTLSAVKKFQRENSLVVDGIVGPKTTAKMLELAKI